MRLVGLLLGLALLAPVQAAAETPSAELMRELMKEAAKVTGLAVPKTLPKITLLSTCGMRLKAAEINKTPYPKIEDCLAPGGIQAMYYKGEIWLPNKWKSDSVPMKGFLIHELTHFMQDQAGMKMFTNPCSGPLVEKQGYAVQFAWLEKHGLDPYKVTGINDQMLLHLTTCVP